MKNTLPVLLAAALAAGGCASAPTPNPELALARAAIDDATDMDSQRYASSELRSARRNLTRAEQAVQNEEYMAAARFAEQARADAELAEAVARATQAEQSAYVIEQSIEALREETRLSYGDES
ncbi:MAG: DUF4398 domain-containing protein [Gammaproteobacteria bacterium]